MFVNALFTYLLQRIRQRRRAFYSAFIFGQPLFHICYIIVTFANHGLTQIETPHHMIHGGVLGINSLAVTYFRMRRAYYHWRWFVSRPCSRWEGVGPNRYGRQA